MWRPEAAAVLDGSRPRGTRRRPRALHPDLEPYEDRTLLSASPLGTAAIAAQAAVVTTSSTNPLSRYRVFEATITRGPHAGLTLTGPLVLGITGRIQVFGYFFPETGGQRITVVGTVFGGAASLRFILPQGGAFEVVGSGRLQKVPNGLFGGESLIGLGNITGPSRNDRGTWLTLAPSRAQGAQWPPA